MDATTLSHLPTIQVIALIASIVSVVIWDYCMIYSQLGVLREQDGFGFFSLFQWIGIGTIGIKSFGVGGGLAFLFVAMIAFPFVWRLLFGKLIQRNLSEDYRTPISLFILSVWSVLGLAVATLIWS